MIKPENVLRKSYDRFGRYEVLIKCEKCGREFTRCRIERRSNPLCGRCWQVDEKEKSRMRNSNVARFDPETKKWFDARPGIESTVMQCDDCGLFFKPSLGHKCRKKKVNECGKMQKHS